MDGHGQLVDVLSYMVLYGAPLSVIAWLLYRRTGRERRDRIDQWAEERSLKGFVGSLLATAVFYSLRITLLAAITAAVGLVLGVFLSYAGYRDARRPDRAARA